MLSKDENKHTESSAIKRSPQTHMATKWLNIVQVLLKYNL